MKIGEQVRKIRKSKGVSQKHLSHTLSISHAAYCCKEKGTRPFKAEELAVIAHELNVDAGIFFADIINEMRNKTRSA